MMQAKEVEALITAMVDPLLQDTGLTLVDVEYVREKDWYLRIFLDKPGGVEIDDCQMVSEKLAEVRDAEDPIPDKYVVEVSSPGIDRPLKKDKDFEAAYGTKVDIMFYTPWEGMKNLTGILVAHDDEAVQVKKIIKVKAFKNHHPLAPTLIAAIRPHTPSSLTTS